MKVTKVQIKLIKPREDGKHNLKAHAKIWLDKVLVINQIKVFVTSKKRHVVFPERRLPMDVTDGEIVTIPFVNPVDKELRDHITEEIFKKYDEIDSKNIDEQEDESE